MKKIENELQQQLKKVIDKNRHKEKELYDDKKECKFGELKKPADDGRVCRKIKLRKSSW